MRVQRSGYPEGRNFELRTAWYMLPEACKLVLKHVFNILPKTVEVLNINSSLRSKGGNDASSSHAKGDIGINALIHFEGNLGMVGNMN